MLNGCAIREVARYRRSIGRCRPVRVVNFDKFAVDEIEAHCAARELKVRWQQLITDENWDDLAR